MKKTKHILLFAVALWTGLSSCSNWLDIDPKDSVTDDKLSETGEGYRIKLNGVYAQMAQSNLYGQNMTWGFADMLGLMYNPNASRPGNAFYEIAH